MVPLWFGCRDSVEKDWELSSFFWLRIRRPPRSTLSAAAAAEEGYKRQYQRRVRGETAAAMSSACYVPASGLSYTQEDVYSFVRYIYAEYWADDLKNDRFVPDVCIRGHFDADVRWTYGGPTANPRLPLVGEYTGHDGMSAFLGGFGELFQVDRWEASKLSLVDGPDGEVIAYVELDAQYRLRDTGVTVHLDELHTLKVRKNHEGEPQICSVRILFDQPALENAVAEGAPSTQTKTAAAP
eukprot:TRINITY_DN2654_c0_g1_i3.p1 TRINITY_DN2654_c0_g1~~TRINITY_DN2654_c0_g1_i3.p1  ORF type:complete len:240 (+),score=51.34 TRINITY_DN2654_c0_g1_i3:25-744(+)